MNVVCPYLVGCFFKFSAGVRRGARGPQVGSALPTHGPLCIYLLEFSFCSDVCLFLLLVAFSAEKTAFLCVQDVFQDSEVVERGIVKVVELKKSEIRFFWQKFSWKICGVKWVCSGGYTTISPQPAYADHRKPIWVIGRAFRRVLAGNPGVDSGTTTRDSAESRSVSRQQPRRVAVWAATALATTPLPASKLSTTSTNSRSVIFHTFIFLLFLLLVAFF